MNSCNFTGNMTKDPESRQTQNGGTVCNFSIAVQRRFKREGQADADFFDCVCFGKSAEYVQKYGEKGTLVIVHGEMNKDPYTDREGNRRISEKVVCDQVEIKGKRSSGNSGGGGQSKSKSNDGFMDIPSGTDEELPFGN